jgi:hypothetical protein
MGVARRFPSAPISAVSTDCHDTLDTSLWRRRWHAATTIARVWA